MIKNKVGTAIYMKIGLLQRKIAFMAISAYVF